MIRIYMMIGAAVAVIGLLAYSHVKVYNAGRAVEQAAIVKRIEKENTDAGANAEKWRADLRRCIADGGMFDYETGTCQP